MRKYVLCDVDHCVSNAFWRDTMIGVETWDDYHRAGVEDKPIHDMVMLVRALSGCELNVIAFTARPEKFRDQTMKWFLKFAAPFEELLMRPTEGFLPAPDIKLMLARERFGDDQGIRDNVAFIMDDRADVMTAFRGIGITCLQVFARRD